MTTPERLKKLTELRTIFESYNTTERRRKACLRIVRMYGKEEMGGPLCIHCGQCIFFAPHEYGLIEGHVYSYLGKKEVGITGLCEFCFDKITEEPDDEEYNEYLEKMGISPDE